ncbi:conserved protein of unknown function [Tenacibaculum sp. 190524A02b]|uniref:Protein involved in gliding motility GldD n=1 Tax=Tenacibaculum vairaonense TaxID=3137860 RepID=A0ABM9PSE9_9FLAO
MRIYILVIGFLLICSCKSSDLKKDFICNNIGSFKNLKTNTDFKKLFTVDFPEHWKVNLYYDNGQSSIYAADTTVSLTQATLLDISLIQSPISIDNAFIQKISTDNSNLKLKEVKGKLFKHYGNTSYYSLANGKKGKYNYHILNLFSKVSEASFLHVKTEIYGDSLVDDRICKAIKLIDEIQLK